MISSSNSVSSIQSNQDADIVTNLRGWTQTGTSTYKKFLKYLSKIRNNPEQIKLEEDIMTEIVSTMTDDDKRKYEFENSDTVEVEEAMDAYNCDFVAV